MKREKSGIKIVFVLLLSALWLCSCGAPSRSSSGSTGSGTIGGGSSTAPAQIAIKSDKSSVKSDNSDSATITATVLDGNNSPVEGVSVSFSISGGQISQITADTDANGQATSSFSSGTIDPINQTVTIEATVVGVDPVQVPVQIIGSTVTLNTADGGTNLTTDGTQTATLTVSAKDAANAGVYNTPVTLTATGSGSVMLSTNSGNTNTSGELSVTVTGVSSGDVTVTAGALGTSATINFTVTAPLDAFQILSPTIDPAPLYTSGSLVITVNAPTSTSVYFATTIGEWGNGSSVQEVLVSGGSASATLTSTSTGTANIQVFDSINPAVTDSIKVAISAPTGDAASLSLQSSVNTLAPSYGEVVNTCTLTAEVKTASGLVVGNAPVAFSIPAGGGTISPVVVYTDASGKASTTFSSGANSSGGTGIEIMAAVVGTSISDTLSIVIGGTAGSIVIGRSTEAQENSDKTAYILPMSVIVADSGGNPMSGASVTLSLWPVQYITDGTQDGRVGVFANEDADEDVYLDPSEDLNGNGELTPPNSSAGTIPATVTTDESGLANFDLTYLKASSRWINARIRASALVQGTETVSTLIFILPATKADIDAGTLPPSPYTAPLIGIPSDVTLSGIAGETVTTVLSPTFGSQSYSFDADSGTFSASTYSYTIPSGYTSGTIITDIITITDTSIPSISVEVGVTITVL